MQKVATILLFFLIPQMIQVVFMYFVVNELSFVGSFTLFQVHLNIATNNVAIVLPLPGNGAEVARSVERDAVR